MITRRTKIQLMVFALITILGITYVGGRYAQLDRLVVDRTYGVKAEFKDSGGIFTGAQVTYRGVGIGRVSDLELTDNGVTATLAIEKSSQQIPAATRAVVANKSAVGEQYIDLQPKSNSGPYLRNDSKIALADTEIPLDTSTLLIDLNGLVNSVDKQNLKTVVSELGTAFNGTGRDLAKIVDTSNAFIETADENFDVTAELIKNSQSVLQTQIDKEDDIKTFSTNLALLSDTLKASDKDLRTVVDQGPVTAQRLRKVIAANADDLGLLINNLRTTNKIAVKYLDGARALLILYPYVVEGGFTVATKDENGQYEAHFGLVFKPTEKNCTDGYREERGPDEVEEIPFDTKVDCDLPPSKAVPRASKNAKFNRSSVVGVYDADKKKLVPTDSQESDFTVPDPEVFGKDSWKWLLLGPTATK